MSDEVWVLGATGRSGGAIAEGLVRRGTATVLVGRDAERLRRQPAAAAGAHIVVAPSLAEMAAAIRRDRPAVVVNTVGPFQRTADPIADATLEAGDYVDLANDIPTVSGILARDDVLRGTGRTAVTGAGFGVTATETVATWLMAGCPPAERVRVDMLPSIASDAGVMGEALAASLLEGMPGVPGGGRFQGRWIADGRLAAAAYGAMPTTLVTPDGDRVRTGSVPFGELIAAANATQGRTVVAAASLAPSGFARVIAPIALNLLHIAPLRRFAIRRLAAMRTTERPRPREHSWAHARIEWSDGTAREGWMRLGDASVFTSEVAADVASRLLAGEGRPGAYTPAALFGTSLATSSGGELLDADVFR
jgi:short subunit dehydrogenase-like uncharacterized protein